MTDQQNILRAEEIIRKLEKKEETIIRGSSAAQALGERLSDSIRTFKAAKDSDILCMAAAIVLLPAIIVAVLVWFLTGSFFYAGIAFLVVALISLVAMADD